MLRRIRSAIAADESTGRESGFTMVELIIAIGVFLIFMSVMISSVAAMTKAINRADTVSLTSSQILNAFQSLDRGVRYADDITTPGTGASGSAYVEFHLSAASSPTGVATCTQWRYVPTTNTLSSRKWNDVSAPTYSGWTIWVTNVVNKGAGYPFVLIPANTIFPKQEQLTFTLSTGTSTADVSTETTTYTAKNTTNASASDCDATGNRP
jgi:prepilin-type N-terminal cleavage/methylation domain-containing protein